MQAIAEHRRPRNRLKTQNAVNQVNSPFAMILRLGHFLWGINLFAFGQKMPMLVVYLQHVFLRAPHLQWQDRHRGPAMLRL
jgi:hypothetical protein